ncbi:MAG TPA: M23 family metallopeptidase, partial [Candidatus Obscuribacterales bacterium]
PVARGFVLPQTQPYVGGEAVEPPTQPELAQLSQDQDHRQSHTAFGQKIPGQMPSVSPVHANQPAAKVPANERLMTDELGQPVAPSAVAATGDKLVFLGPKGLWMCDRGDRNLLKGTTIVLASAPAPKQIDGIPVQEFNNLIGYPPRNSVVVLDKSGDLFEFLPHQKRWRIFRANAPTSGSPDPDYVDLAWNGSEVVLLDPERNQIWRCTGNNRVLHGYFAEVMPWRVKAGDHMVGDGLSIACDDVTYVLKRGGNIFSYGRGGERAFRQIRFHLKAPGRVRPSRLITLPASPLFVVERENNRVLAVDKVSGKTDQFLYPQDSDIRGLLPAKGGFWLINKDRLTFTRLDQKDKRQKAPEVKRIDARLDGLTMPIKGMRLPAHPGVFPGARRLYRFGVHKGVDFFHDGGAKAKVVIGTPVIAADNGEIVRLDRNFRDMDAAKFSAVMSQCLREHQTSEANEDRFRGCQVWIDHGNGLMTRYAHLSKINAKVKENSFVNRGDVIGYVGVSGTGQNLPGRARYPHLHFEIWLDGKYLGWGLTPAETFGVYEDIFGVGR